MERLIGNTERLYLALSSLKARLDGSPQLVGTRYRRLPLPEQRHWFEELGLALAVWQGEYQDAEGRWLRWQDNEGNWIPTASDRAEQERQRAERLAARLRELGIDPEAI